MEYTKRKTPKKKVLDQERTKISSRKILTEKLCKKFSTTLKREDVEDSLKSIISTLKKEICANKRLEIRSFGVLCIKKRKHPVTKEQYATLSYKMSKSLGRKISPDRKM